ncbi:MAG: response regulator transcription factor [Chloroflexi bacterium]|nr:response regulator transcription factor [Chloroflexota bacterium]
MNQKYVLAIDDDARFLRLLRMNIEPAGYHFTGVTTGEQAIDVLASTPTDLVLLDVRMAGMDGFHVITAIREFSDVPVIFVTAAGEESDKVQGLTLGADDYLTKPLGPKELLARMTAVLRRYHGNGTDAQITVRDLHLDLAQRRLFRDKSEIPLTRMEYRLLACLARHLGKVVPQEQLVRDVWGPFYDQGYEGLRVYIYRLRKKLEADPDSPDLLVTVPGIGYTMNP